MTDVQGCLVLHPAVHTDDRGCFSELFHLERYRPLVGDIEWVQQNASKSHKNVVRGLHIANFSKLVTCLRGSILDVVVDCRNNSPTFGNHLTQYMDGPTVQVFVPAGCAHGFMALEDHSVVVYMQSGMYDPASERSILWNDPHLAIPWPYAEEAIVSERDRKAPRFHALGGRE